MNAEWKGAVHDGLSDETAGQSRTISTQARVWQSVRRPLRTRT